jgi:hypothetical protein
VHSLRIAGAMILAAPFFVTSTFVACAQDNKNNNPAVYRDVETKYIFGFTDGSGIGLEGEKEFSWESVARFGKADGRYWASETKLTYEFTPNQYVQFEFGPLASTHNIKNVTDFENRSQVAFGGFFGEIRYLLLDRVPHRHSQSLCQRSRNGGERTKPPASVSQTSSWHSRSTPISS